MKYLLVCTTALAVGVSFADTSVIPYEKLTLADGTTFSATADGTISNATITPENPTIEDGYYMLDGELTATTAALAMAASGVDKTDIEQFTITFKAGFVDATELPTFDGAKIGFALTSGTTAKYFNGTEWVEFDEFSSEVTEDKDVIVMVDFDGRQNKARFTLGEEVLMVSKSEWVTVGGIGANTIKAFGSGAVKSLAGLTKTIESAKIDDAGGVVIAGGDVSAFEKAAGDTPIADFVAAKASEKIANFAGDANVKVADAYAIGLIVKDKDGALAPNADGGKLIVKKATNATPDSTKIPLALNTTVPAGNKVQYQLMGRNDDTTWEKVGDPNTVGAAISIPLNTTLYKYYKVEATVVPANE